MPVSTALAKASRCSSDDETPRPGQASFLASRRSSTKRNSPATRAMFCSNHEQAERRLDKPALWKRDVCAMKRVFSDFLDSECPRSDLEVVPVYVYLSVADVHLGWHARDVRPRAEWRYLHDPRAGDRGGSAEVGGRQGRGAARAGPRWNKELAKHRIAMTASLGDRFIETCANHASDAELGCTLAARTSEAAKECMQAIAYELTRPTRPERYRCVANTRIGDARAPAAWRRSWPWSRCLLARA